MATYDVIAPGFIDGITHTPDHKTRNVVITDVPFKKVPAWLKLRSGKEMTPAQKAAATKARRKEEESNFKAVADNKKDISAATFMATGAGVVESL
jgi:hypothetical protein